MGSISLTFTQVGFLTNYEELLGNPNNHFLAQ